MGNQRRWRLGRQAAWSRGEARGGGSGTGPWREVAVDGEVLAEEAVDGVSAVVARTSGLRHRLISCRGA
jgi:hypothetical protein